MVERDALAVTLRAEAGGGRVAHAPFLEPSDADALLRAVRVPGVDADGWGGFAGARRRVVTVRPDHVPAATPALVAWYVDGAHDPEELRAALLAAGVEAGVLGDVVGHADGCSVVALASAAAPATVVIGGHTCSLAVVSVERIKAAASKRSTVVVPALRVDVLGARAFGVSRSWFAKGVAAGRVRLNGRLADKRSDVAAGDELWAEGLGRFRLVALLGTTRKGSQRIELEVERS